MRPTQDTGDVVCCLAVDFRLVLIYVCRGGGADHKENSFSTARKCIIIWLGYHRSLIDCCSYKLLHCDQWH